MTEDQNELQAKLVGLNITLEGEFQNALDSNADIIGATKKMAHNLLIIRNAHLQEADRLFAMVENLAESCLVTADLIGDMVAAEWGLDQFLAEVNADDDDEDTEEEE